MVLVLQRYYRLWVILLRLLSWPMMQKDQIRFLQQRLVYSNNYLEFSMSFAISEFYKIKKEKEKQHFFFCSNLLDSITDIRILSHT